MTPKMGDATSGARVAGSLLGRTPTRARVVAQHGATGGYLY